MRRCEQSSQRSTWPPRAAVRQLSMADMTFSCPRLTRPALALRQAGPWRRKISATSIAGRDKGKPRSGGWSYLGEQQVERAGDLADRLDGDPGVERRGVELLVPEQHLDDAYVGLLFEQMRGEAVPQGMHAHALVDPGAPRGRVYGVVKPPHGEGLARNTARKQPFPWPFDQPPPPQQIEQLLRQHHVAVFVALALI